MNPFYTDRESARPLTLTMEPLKPLTPAQRRDMRCVTNSYCDFFNHLSKLNTAPRHQTSLG